jgi:methyl-accepting chemotaxis protein
MKIQTRLMVGFGLVLALLLSVAATGVWSVHTLGGIVQDLSSARAKMLSMAKQLEQNVTANLVRSTVVLTIDDLDLERAIKAELAQDAKALEEIMTALTQAADPQEQAALQEISGAAKKYLDLRTALIARHSSGNSVTDELKGQLMPLGKTYIGTIEKFVAGQQKQFETQGEHATGRAQFATAALLLVSVIALGAGVALALLIARGIVAPLLAARNAALAVAGGDLSLDLARGGVIAGKDETAELVRAVAEMTAQLRKVVGQVREGVDAVASASQEIARGNQDLSTRTEQQAANLEQTAASMDQITSTLRSSADNAKQANQLAAAASEVAGRGGHVVGEVVHRMDEISASSKKIADIIGVIDGIAFQTNILALNAAVEAARAGEQGRGFAVVAAEVRNLAQRSAQAAREIKSLIADSVTKVENGAKLVHEAGQTMDDIVGQVKRVSDLIGEITSATLEQNNGLVQVNQAVGHMDQMTQQNAALVEQSAAAAGSLKDQAARLAQAISVFKLNRAAA